MEAVTDAFFRLPASGDYRDSARGIRQNRRYSEECISTLGARELGTINSNVSGLRGIVIANIVAAKTIECSFSN